MAFKDLFNPKYKHSDPEVRRKALGKLEDQNILAEISKNDEDLAVRMVANKRLGKENSQDAHADVAKNDMNYEVRKRAVEKLNDQELLADIAKNDENEWVREKAIEKLDLDKWQELLTDVSKNDESVYVRQIAIKKIEDQELLARIAQNDLNEFVRKVAVESLENQELLANIAENVEDDTVREIAFKKLDRDKWKVLFLEREKHASNELNRILTEIGHNNREKISYHRYRAFCNSCDMELEAPEGFIGIPFGSESQYLMCKACFDRGFTKSGHDPHLARQRAVAWWITGDPYKTREAKL